MKPTTICLLIACLGVLILVVSVLGLKNEWLLPKPFSAPAKPNTVSREVNTVSGATGAGYPNPERKIKTATVDMGWQKLVFSNVVSAVEHEPDCVLIKHGDGEFHAWAVPVKIEYETVP